MKYMSMVYGNDGVISIYFGKHCMFVGNEEDFYSGCHGTKIPYGDGRILNLEKYWTDQNGPHAVANLFRLHLGVSVDNFVIYNENQDTTFLIRAYKKHTGGFANSWKYKSPKSLITFNEKFY